MAANVVQSDVAAGTVRISTAEGFGTAVLASELPSLAQSRRGLRIELAATSGFLSPTRREVDMAITLSPPEAGRLVVEPLARYQLALYAAPEYLDRSGRPTEVEDIKALDLVGYVDDLLYAPELRYLDQVLPGLAPRLASSSIRAQQAIIAAGGGVGVLPGFMAEGLEPVLPDKVRIERRFWLSTHKDVHMTARMRVVRQWLQDVIVRKQSQLCPWGPAD
jgi:DNA-binding transcriptional LysR family regulator